MHSSVYAVLSKGAKKRSALEYHVFARFRCNGSGVRIAITLSERTAQKVGNWASEYADDVWYKLKPRNPDTKSYRKKKR